ncbi:hypothetical protein ID875_27320 [Streptomyces globisporus]|uniref:AMP-binding enzyme C-terminal domain-containing protein n=1 Tax=Streptomyces globisporus TaxID=1908 RepID=A0A927BNT9_STRGL|nr:hypothetical protein [Streptomyces globisporus]
MLEARVTGVPGRTATGPTTRLHAEVVSLRGTGADSAELHRHAQDRLAPYKVPDRIRAVGELPRGRSESCCPHDAWSRRRGDADRLRPGPQAQRTPLHPDAVGRPGPAVAGPADSARVAGELGLDAEVCEQLLQVAESAGLLRAAPPEEREATRPRAPGPGERRPPRDPPPTPPTARRPSSPWRSGSRGPG